MQGQEIQSRKTEARDIEQHDAVMEILRDARDERSEIAEILKDERIERSTMQRLVHEVHQILVDTEDLEKRANRSHS